jgi:ATP-dependent exoDNAse (exonuclease V) beta subunit
MGVRHENLIGKDASRAVVDDTLAAYRKWEETRGTAIARGSRPSLQVTTASEWAAGDAPLPGGGEMPDVRVEAVPARDDRDRPSGPAFGALVHATLAHVALDAGPEAIAAVAATHARLLGASPEAAAAASGVAGRVLAHPLVRQAAGAASCRREAPLTLSDGAKSIVEGVADLVFEADSRWIVVDFKTDVEIGRQGIERYRRQVGLYAAAVARATGRAATGVLLRI